MKNKIKFIFGIIFVLIFVVLFALNFISALTWGYIGGATPPVSPACGSGGTSTGRSCDPGPRFYIDGSGACKFDFSNFVGANCIPPGQPDECTCNNPTDNICWVPGYTDSNFYAGCDTSYATVYRQLNICVPNPRRLTKGCGISEPFIVSATASGGTVKCNVSVSREDKCVQELGAIDNKMTFSGTVTIRVITGSSFTESTNSISGTITGRGVQEFPYSTSITNLTSEVTCSVQITEIGVKDSTGAVSDQPLCSSSKSLQDFDNDSYWASDYWGKDQVDFADWPYGGAKSDTSFNCNNILEHYSLANCTQDSNNDAIGDYAECAYCKNPGMAEAVDNIDNNGQGLCQGNTFKSCRVTGSYIGDGDSSSDCAGVMSPALGFAQPDNFCQMVDEGICGDYERAVKYGAGLELSGKTSYKHYNYTYYPGGINGLNADCTKKLTDSTKPNLPPVVSIEKSFFPTSEAKGNKRGTVESTGAIFPEQFIDSFRGECDFTAFWNTLKTDGFIEDGVLDSDWQWQTACVAKDKCADSADNNGPTDLLTTEPYGYFIHTGKEAGNRCQWQYRFQRVLATAPDTAYQEIGDYRRPDLRAFIGI